MCMVQISQINIYLVHISISKSEVQPGDAVKVESLTCRGGLGDRTRDLFRPFLPNNGQEHHDGVS
jgi:hypothetical protein